MLPLNKYIEEITQELDTIRQQIQTRAIELQRNDRILQEFLRKQADKQAVLDWLMTHNESTEDAPNDPPKEEEKKTDKPFKPKRRKNNV